MSRVTGALGASLAGLALGAASWVSDELGSPTGLLIPANLIGVWLAVAFLLGASARAVPHGALRGLIGLVAAVAGCYLLFAVSGNGIRAIGASHAATAWGAVAVIAGPLLGAAGSAWRTGNGRKRAFAAGLLAAALIGEGVVFGWTRLLAFDPLIDPGSVILAVEIAIGVMLPFVALRPHERIAGIAATVIGAAATIIALGPLTSILRGIADRF